MNPDSPNKEHPEPECRECIMDSLSELLREEISGQSDPYTYCLNSKYIRGRKIKLNNLTEKEKVSNDNNYTQPSCSSSSSSNPPELVAASSSSSNPPELVAASSSSSSSTAPVAGSSSSSSSTSSTAPVVASSSSSNSPEEKVPILHNDDSLNYLRELISSQIQQGQVSTVKLGSLPKTKETIDIANRVAHLLTQERILAKLHLLNKYMDVNDWSSAWEQARTPIEKVQSGDYEVEQQLVYGMYALLLRNNTQVKLEKFLRQNFPSNLKSVEAVIARMEPLVKQELEGKRPISLVHESKFSYDIITMTKAIAKQFICACLLNEIMLVSTRNCSLNSFTLKSDDSINDESLLEAYQYLLGTMNDPFRANTVERFREWFIHGNTLTV